jgi:hypothetical protein
MPEAIISKLPHIHWLYLWLAISVIGNIIGLSSLVEGVVTWAAFFKDIIDLYREYIRGPIAFIGNHLWPFGKIPGWVFDFLIVYLLFYISANIASILRYKKSFISSLVEQIGHRRIILITVLVFLPFHDIVIFFLQLFKINKTVDEDVYITMSIVGIILIIFIILLFINYQILHPPLGAAKIVRPAD